MLLSIFRYELRYILKRPAAYLYFLAFWGLSFVSFAGTAGYFDPPTATTQAQNWLNSPYSIHYFLQYSGKFFLFLLPAVVGQVIFKDYQTRIHLLLYAFPIKKEAYLVGKFGSALLVVLGITLASGLGMLIAEVLPGMPTAQLGPTRLAGYLQAYGLYIWPNMLAQGLLVFAAGVRFRSRYTGFAVVIGLILLQILLENIFVNQPLMAALTDPFGQNTAQFLTRYWTLAEQNTLLLPVNSLVLLNRLLWLTIGGGVFVAAMRGFSFTETNAHERKKKRPVVVKNTLAVPVASTNPPKVKYSFGFSAQLRAAFRLSVQEFRFMAGSWMFAGLAALGIATVVFALLRVTSQAELTLLPVTHLVLGVPTLFFVNIVLLLTFLYSGILVHRERMAGMEPLVDSSPLPNWVFLASKTWAIWYLQLLLLFMLMATGLVMQSVNGYFHFEIGLYLFHLFVLVFVPLAIWAMAALFVQVLMPNVFGGIFLLLLGWLAIGFLADSGFGTRWLNFNHHAPLTYSDIDGYGHALVPYLYEKLYWLMVGGLLLIGAHLFWYRGLMDQVKERVSIAIMRLNSPIAGLTLFLLAGVLAVGFDIWKKENAGHGNGDQNLKQAFALFEKNYSRYAALPQPQIKSMQVSLDFFPDEQRFQAKGNYRLRNETSFDIDTLLIKTGFDEKSTFELSCTYSLVKADAQMNFYVLKLDAALAPGDSLTLSFTVESKPNDFFVRNSNVLTNGSFIRQDAFPRIGYFPTQAPLHPQDSLSGQHNYQSPDADRLAFEAVVSTSNDQVALAPGKLLKTWEVPGRRFYQYRMDIPIKFAFSFHSGRYRIARKQWKGTLLQVYYHPSHGYQLAEMFRGLESALDYNTRYFGPYQHSSATIVEFPNSEGSFATSFANMIPLSESRFIVRTHKPDHKINLPFYVSAHELTHQWWGNQVLPAHAEGALMLTESITEYLSLKMYAHTFGKKDALDFLRVQRERYLTGRSKESGTEPPLVRVLPEQQYIAYGKGALAFHTLGEALGEAKLNQVLSQFLTRYKFKAAPYPTSHDLLQLLYAQTPDSLKYLLYDYFETVTLHKATLTDARVFAMPDGQYRVNLTVAFQKTNGAGAMKSEFPFSNFLGIGCYDEQGKQYYLHTACVDAGFNQFSFTVSGKPARLELDPDLLLIEVDRADNTWVF